MPSHSRTITFVTTNNGKFEEIKRWCAELAPDINLELAAIDLPEYQSMDVEEIALGKVQEAWNLLQRPVLVDDGGLYIEKYNQFPGAFSKWVYQGIGLEGIWKLAQDNPRAYFLSHLVYTDQLGCYQHFQERCYGTLIKPVDTGAHVHLPYTAMFIPDGSTQTLSALRGTEQEKEFHHRYKALQNLIHAL